jgi:hypothetical protein
LCGLIAAACCAPAAAQALLDERDRLAAHVQAHPDDDAATFRFVVVATELQDYEAAIGALERLLMFNPDLSRARKELGFLYARLGNWELAAQHLREARASATLDPLQKAQIDAQLPDIEKRTETSRISVRLHTGLRAQSNANYFPANSLFQVGGAGVLSPGGPKGDVNAFQLVQAAHDYEFGARRGDQLETRITAYATEQFRLPQYSVALFAGSIGPRFFVPQRLVNGLSVRPYVHGALSLLGGQSYLNTGGAGLSLRADLTPDAWLEPGAEWRNLWVAPTRGVLGVTPDTTLSTLATGDAVTGYLGGGYTILESVTFEGRFGYTRANASVPAQRSNQFDAQAMLRLEVDPPHPGFARRWTISPYARFTHLSFDAPNPLVSPFVARRDAAWTYGVTLDAPITPMLGFSGYIEVARNASNLPNFATQNVSVSFGPTAKF